MKREMRPDAEGIGVVLWKREVRGLEDAEWEGDVVVVVLRRE